MSYQQPGPQWPFPQQHGPGPHAHTELGPPPAVGPDLPLRLTAWLVDALICLGIGYLAVSAVVVIAAMTTLSDSACLALGLAALLTTPALYGSCCAGGRSVGTLTINTRFVVTRTGLPVGRRRMAWIMFARMAALAALVPALMFGDLVWQPVWHGQRFVG